MVNIILKHKTLVKAYKTGKIIFKWLNKHFYIMSIISLFARWRKSNVYYIIKYLMKIVLVINIVITSGIFFSVADLVTPLEVIHNFYKDLLGPYIELVYNYIKELYNNILNYNNKLETKMYKNYLNKPIVNNDLVEVIETDKVDETKYSITRIILVGASVALVLYFFFVLPPAPPTGGEDKILKNFNIFDKTLMDIKIWFKDLKNTLDVLTTEEDLPKVTNSAPISPLKIENSGLGSINSPTVSDPLTTPRASSIPMDTTPTPSTSGVKLEDIRTGKVSLNDLPKNGNISPHTSNLVDNSTQTVGRVIAKKFITKSTQTDLTALQIGKTIFSNDIISQSAPENFINKIVELTNQEVTDIADRSKSSKLLKSTQLLENNNDD